MAGSLRASPLAILAAAALLLWPAALNHYPLLFGDSGVYLLDGVRLHMSWPRPLFYGLFMRALHLGLSAWPVAAAQAGIAALVLDLALRCLVPGLAAWTVVPAALVLAVCTSLPWFVSQLMPDVFGGLLLLSLVLVLLTPERLGRGALLALVLFAAFCTTLHLTFLPIGLAVILVLLLVRVRLGAPVRAVDLARAAAVPALALLVATGANAALAGRVSPSPYGKIFVLARVLLDGPGQRALERKCPRPDWTLCAFKDRLPDNVDAFLFGDQGVVSRAGGYQVVAQQAWPIVLSALRAEPGAMLADAVRNTAAQFVRFRTGDALLVPMANAAEAWREVFPGAEQDRYRASLQYRMLPLVPDWLQAVHLAVGGAALLAVAAGAWIGLRRRRVLGGVHAAILTGLAANAFVTGALSGVFDRYQSRLVWLASFAVLLMMLDRWWPSRAPLDPGQKP